MKEFKLKADARFYAKDLEDALEKLGKHFFGVVNEVDQLEMVGEFDLKVVRKYEIWIEGYLATGMEGIPSPAEKVGTVIASSFQEACDQLYGGKDNYDSENLRYWDCKLYDNEADARNSFG